ncbi:MAG: NAD-dependent epimerase/dehydratase family protein [Candidatus Marinimicrobia bacterium]|jgi:nucleoside-diphosphate-sugar epimerase|nr:NAD-dependent epimerase/dehydratase family protein [Candidatus Neomarinimicrobiota bacterium]MBT4851020.1 NAD-dependent epimerase/dehydratase family protein [Candidatus Neomarinimicrobiota bacterium]MBT6713624.1 NAD-dependent epimerase/dehydratase family protein [Candidatus Neomarinimicrobiota bacterium]MBT7021617.1 NAD-dependent epimerase/dehydratase family protein [Candidatus Neomarinimicrobiota bacterium]MBT7884652.1 NAD-dependent epimerase/dehydratase family protein [Candidatus Neomarini
MILIIGGSGFVGTELIKLIGKENCLNLDKNDSTTFPDITIICDIRDVNLIDYFPDNIEKIVLLAAEHRDDVSPTSLYYDVNVRGTKNVLNVIDKKGIDNVIFTSSVAVYGLNKKYPDENQKKNPFNHYGKSKWEAEKVLVKWYEEKSNRSLTIVRPTVIFGERNRGNVYHLLKHIVSGKFIMIGDGKNRKSMAYVCNIAEFLKFQMKTTTNNYKVFNYVDKPDYSMNELVEIIEKYLKISIPSIRIPYWFGLFCGFSFNILSKLIGKKFSISAVRIRKFCATTQFNAELVHNSGFIAPFTISEGLERTLNYEFIEKDKDSVTSNTKNYNQ